MPINVLDRKPSEELCLGGSSALANPNARPDRSWLQAIAHSFVELEAMAVTQLVAQVSLEPMAQIYFEYGYGMVRRLRYRRPLRCHPRCRHAQG
jgi:hypothetical protein